MTPTRLVSLGTKTDTEFIPVGCGMKKGGNPTAWDTSRPIVPNGGNGMFALAVEMNVNAKSPGREYRLEAYARYGPPRPGDIAFAFVSTGRAIIPLPVPSFR